MYVYNTHSLLLYYMSCARAYIRFGCAYDREAYRVAGKFLGPPAAHLKFETRRSTWPQSYNEPIIIIIVV